MYLNEKFDTNRSDVMEPVVSLRHVILKAPRSEKQVDNLGDAKKLRGQKSRRCVLTDATAIAKMNC